MTKHWMTKKAIVVMFEIKPSHLDKLRKNGAVRTRYVPRKEGQRGRNPLVFNCADVKAFLKMDKDVRKVTLNISKHRKALGEKSLKGSKDLDDAINDFNKSHWHYKKDNSAWDSLKKMPEEMVNHPKHYNPGKIEVIDAIEDWRLDFNEGNVIKYIVRAKRKNNRKQDLQKALWYIQRMLDNL
tara:strand:+ start:24898 stop:25446 length:549 start_codon:yes stop_codon:yes gene_type:complete